MELIHIQPSADALYITWKIKILGGTIKSINYTIIANLNKSFEREILWHEKQLKLFQMA